MILGTIADGGLRMRHVARFANDPVQLPDGLHWNALELYQQVLGGLAEAERQSPGEIISVGIDSWAVDYGLLRGGALLGVPYHYRDERTAEGVKTVHAQYDPAACTAATGCSTCRSTRCSSWPASRSGWSWPTGCY